jgi:hypothetical protein
VIYIAAKLTEHFDVIIYELLGFSGHSLKHIIAAPSGWVLIPMLKNLQLNSVDS